MISVFFDDWIENIMESRPLVSQFLGSYGWFDQPQTVELIRAHGKGCLLFGTVKKKVFSIENKIKIKSCVTSLGS